MTKIFFMDINIVNITTFLDITTLNSRSQLEKTTLLKKFELTACLALINLKRWKSVRLARILAAANFLAQLLVAHFLSISAFSHCFFSVDALALCGIFTMNFVK